MDIPRSAETCDDVNTIAQDPERLVKSAARVRDLGEVFTPAATVNAMLDLIPYSMWIPHPAATFLEPACGDGNFLVEILRRKLAQVGAAGSSETLAAGTGEDAILFHALEALSSIYAVDISVDNVIGGTPGHEVGARTRLLEVFRKWHHQELGKQLSSRSVLLASALWIVERNVQVGNMLPFNGDGTPGGRDILPLVEYEWHPRTLNVAVSSTTLGAVAESAGGDGPEGQGALMFAPPEPEVVWHGNFKELRCARIDAPDDTRGAVRNSQRRSK